MIEHVQTVRTRSLQVWLRPDEASLGWRHPGATDGDERRLLESFLALPAGQRTQADIDEVLKLIRRHGSIEAASAWADGLAAGARAAFPSAFEHVVSRFHARFIADMIDFVVARGS